ncbi:MAG: TonB-dependent receptor [Sphingomonadaceae bacterium]
MNSPLTTSSFVFYGQRLRLFSSMTALAIAGFATPVAAETTSDDNEEIIVSGSIRDSMLRSIEMQRDADNMAVGISSDDIGQFPDETAAAALDRLPGVSVQRDQGQERYVQVRGAPTRWTQVAIDNLNILGAEDRVFRFDSIPAAQISSVLLNRTLLPEMPSEALAGRVDIRTYSALANPGLHVFAEGGLGFVDLGDGKNEKYAGRISWGNDKWGFSAAGSHYAFEQQTDNSEPRFDEIGLRQQRFTKYIINRVVEAASGKIEFAPTTGHKLSALYLHSTFTDFEERNWYRFGYDSAFSGTRDFETADLIGVPMDSSHAYGDYRNGLDTAILRGEHEFGNGWRFNWHGAYTETFFSQYYPVVTGQVTNSLTTAPTGAQALLLPSMHVDVNAVNKGFPYHQLYTTVLNAQGVPTRGDALIALPQTSLNNYYFGEQNSKRKTKAWTAKADLAKDWESFGADATFSVGIQWDDRNQLSTTENFVRPDGTISTGNRTLTNLATLSQQLGVPFNFTDFLTRDPWEAQQKRGFTAVLNNNKAMVDQIDKILAAAAAANAAGGNFPVYGNDPKLTNTVVEKVLAGYIQNRWKWDRHMLLLGLRAEQTKINTVGIAVRGSDLIPLSLESKDTKFFPSVHYSFDATDDLKLRAAFITGSARPSLTAMRATVTINDTSETISGGNPYLRPETAYGFDASAEWYFAPGAILSVSGYHREVDGVLYSSTMLVGGDDYNADGVDRSQYLLSTTLNGNKGHLTGLEIAYSHPFTFLPGALSGLGVEASVAFNWGNFRTPDGAKEGFAGTSRRITKATIFYEKDGFSARLSYNHRTKWLDEAFGSGSCSTPGCNLYWGPQQRLSLGLRYQLNDMFTIFFNGENLTNEDGVRYQGVPERPYEVETFGRKYLAGIRFTY